MLSDTHSCQVLTPRSQVDERTRWDLISPFFPLFCASKSASVCWIRLCGDKASPRSGRKRQRKTYSQFTWKMNGKRGRKGGDWGAWDWDCDLLRGAHVCVYEWMCAYVGVCACRRSVISWPLWWRWARQAWPDNDAVL